MSSPTDRFLRAELFLRNESLVTENRILRKQIAGRLRLSDPDRISLAEIGKRLGRKALAEVAQIVGPETILGSHPTYCYDLHATILYLLGIDHTSSTFRHNGIDRRLRASSPAAPGLRQS